MSIYSLNKDILHLLIKKYIRPLDYHRVLRVSKLFHVLSDDERIQKEIDRREDQKKSGNPKRNCHKICHICHHPLPKKERLRQYHYQNVCDTLINRKSNTDSDNFKRHIVCLSVKCSCGKCSIFYFPEMAKHKQTCIGKLTYKILDISSYYGAYKRYQQRLLAQQINLENKEKQKYRRQKETMLLSYFL